MYRTGVPATADEVLEAPDDDANSFTAVKAVVADVAGDGHQEVAFGFHQQGSGGILAVDLVGADGSVVVHRDYGGGSAKAQKGQLDGWGSDSPSTGPYTHEVIEYRSAAWRIVSTATTSTAPAGNL